MVNYEIYVDDRTGENYVVVPTVETNDAGHVYRYITHDSALTIANKYFKTKISNLIIGGAFKSYDKYVRKSQYIKFYKDFDLDTFETLDILTQGNSNCWVIMRKGVIH